MAMLLLCRLCSPRRRVGKLLAWPQAILQVVQACPQVHPMVYHLFCQVVYRVGCLVDCQVGCRQVRRQDFQQVRKDWLEVCRRECRQACRRLCLLVVMQFSSAMP
mmetsp:Transcript_47259/g.119704  ORF Transcript_47259/g.119704 Transcript_47259/m.119704 type:complete len:105 (-) Transcript_47259:666-980(-)